MRSFRLVAFATLIGLSALVCARERAPSASVPAARRPATGSPLGTNLDGITDYSAEWSLLDTFKRSRPWISGAEDKWDDGRRIDVDADGWVRSLAPGQLARTLMLWDLPTYPGGIYDVTYKGEGTLSYGPQDEVLHVAPGHDLLHVYPGKGGIGIVIRSTNPKNYLRDFHVVMPGGACERERTRSCTATLPCAADDACVPFAGHEGERPFHPAFLERIRPYDTLRFMDWMKTNGSTVAHYGDRPKPTDARYTEKGVPVEVMVALANESGHSAWFCIPHLADDDYVQQFAQYVRDHLRPGLLAYVEHSNEVWNSVFPQAAYAREQGRKEGLGPSDYEAQLLHHAKRSVEIFRIWERVFGDKKRIVRVLGAQASNAWASELMLRYSDTAKHTDALAIAPYFGGYLGAPPERARVSRMSPDDLYEELRARALPEALDSVGKQAAIAKRYSVDLVAYEGGQHLVGVGAGVDDDKLNALFDRINRDPRMKDLYRSYLRGWREQGGHLFVHFVNTARYSKWGRWGALESLDEARDKAPKFDALLEFAEQNPRWW